MVTNQLDISKCANFLPPYPVAKREHAKERYQEDMAKGAEKQAKELAKKTLEEEKQRAELEEFRKWKLTVSEKVEEQPKKTAPKKTEKKKTAPKKTPVKQQYEKCPQRRGLILMMNRRLRKLSAITHRFSKILSISMIICPEIYILGNVLNPMSEVLSYKYPQINPAVRANQETWNESKSINGSKFSRIFYRIEIRFGGVTVESLTHYADLVAMYCSSVPQMKAALLKLNEDFGGENWHVESGRIFTHLLMSSLWITDQTLPTALIQSGGITLELLLSRVSNYFVSHTDAYYELREPCLKWPGLTPDPSFTIGLRFALAQILLSPSGYDLQ